MTKNAIFYGLIIIAAIFLIAIYGSEFVFGNLQETDSSKPLYFSAGAVLLTAAYFIYKFNQKP